jgi:hypothetical protein
LQLMKCGECETVSPVGEENEEYLYSYTLNETATTRLADQIKPIEACSTYFRSLGYVVATPAFVMGKSGTQHIFDMLLLNSTHRTSVPEDVTAHQLGSGRNTVVEILVSSNPIELGEITRVYGKVCDIDCEAMVFAVPVLTNDARHYAEQFKIRVLEGTSIDEALNKPGMISFATERTPTNN